MKENIEKKAIKINQELLNWADPNYIDKYYFSEREFEEILYLSVIQGSASQYYSFLMVFLPYWKLWDCNKWDVFLNKIGKEGDYHVTQLLIFITKYLSTLYLERFKSNYTLPNKEAVFLFIEQNSSIFEFNKKYDQYLIDEYLHRFEDLSMARNSINISLTIFK